MNTEIRVVHYELDEKTKEYLDKKLERLDFAKDLVMDLHITITRDKDFKAEATISFRWGLQAHIIAENYNVVTAIDSLADKIKEKVGKEKEKIQEKG